MCFGTKYQRNAICGMISFCRDMRSSPMRAFNRKSAFTFSKCQVLDSLLENINSVSRKHFWIHILYPYKAHASTLGFQSPSSMRLYSNVSSASFFLLESKTARVENWKYWDGSPLFACLSFASSRILGKSEFNCNNEWNIFSMQHYFLRFMYDVDSWFIFKLHLPVLKC